MGGGNSVHFGAGQRKVFVPRTTLHAGQGYEIQAPPSIYGAPLYVTGPHLPSAAPPGSLFFAAPCLGPCFHEPILL